MRVPRYGDDRPATCYLGTIIAPSRTSDLPRPPTNASTTLFSLIKPLRCTRLNAGGTIALVFSYREQHLFADSHPRRASRQRAPHSRRQDRRRANTMHAMVLHIRAQSAPQHLDRAAPAREALSAAAIRRRRWWRVLVAAPLRLLLALAPLQLGGDARPELRFGGPALCFCGPRFVGRLRVTQRRRLGRDSALLALSVAALRRGFLLPPCRALSFAGGIGGPRVVGGKRLRGSSEAQAHGMEIRPVEVNAAEVVAEDLHFGLLDLVACVDPGGCHCDGGCCC